MKYIYIDYFEDNPKRAGEALRSINRELKKLEDLPYRLPDNARSGAREYKEQLEHEKELLNYYFDVIKEKRINKFFDKWEKRESENTTEWIKNNGKLIATVRVKKLQASFVVSTDIRNFSSTMNFRDLRRERENRCRCEESLERIEAEEKVFCDGWLDVNQTPINAIDNVLINLSQPKEEKKENIASALATLNKVLTRETGEGLKEKERQKYMKQVILERI